MMQIKILRAKTEQELASAVTSLLNTGSWTLCAVVYDGNEWIGFVQGSYR